MLMPKRVKYRRVQRGRMTGKALRGNKVTYGELDRKSTRLNSSHSTSSRMPSSA